MDFSTYLRQKKSNMLFVSCILSGKIDKLRVQINHPLNTRYQFIKNDDTKMLPSVDFCSDYYVPESNRTAYAYLIYGQCTLSFSGSEALRGATLNIPIDKVYFIFNIPE